MAEQRPAKVLQEDPFGEQPGPWYRRPANAAPKSWARPLGVVCGLLATAAAAEVHSPWRLAIWLAVAGGPPWALDAWWRWRRRRREDLLMPGLASD